MTLKQFKWVDLLLFSIVAVIFEVINHFASANLSSFKVVFMSFTIVLTLISMYRWGVSGLVVLVFASVVSVAITAQNKEIEAYTAYTCGGILGMIPGFIIFQIIIGKKRIKNPLLMIAYLLFSFACVITLRSLISALFHLDTFHNTLVDNLKILFIQESMSFATSLIILLVANRKKGNVVVDMRHYVKEVQDSKKLGNLKEIKESPNFNADRSFTEFNQLDESNILDGGTMDDDQLKELEKMYKEYGNITNSNPMDCLTEHEVEKK